MKYGRKTTLEERVNVVAFCIVQDKNYKLAAQIYRVSYQQVYTWVKKYENKGLHGLTDARGRPGNRRTITELEGLRLENKLLQAKLKEKEAQITLLKKLRVLEWGGG